MALAEAEAEAVVAGELDCHLKSMLEEGCFPFPKDVVVVGGTTPSLCRDDIGLLSLSMCDGSGELGCLLLSTSMCMRPAKE